MRRCETCGFIVPGIYSEGVWRGTCYECEAARLKRRVLLAFRSTAADAIAELLRHSGRGAPRHQPQRLVEIARRPPEHVAIVLAKLSKPQRRVWDGLFVRGLDDEALAAELRLSVGAVRHHLARIRRLFHEAGLPEPG